MDCKMLLLMTGVSTFHGRMERLSSSMMAAVVGALDHDAHPFTHSTLPD